MDMPKCTHKRTVRYGAAFCLLAGLVILLSFLNLCMGSSSLTLREVFAVLTGSSTDETAVRILTMIRLPRMLAALVLGGALSVAGFQLQCFFGNPIAGPFVLGISSGAKLTVALALVCALQGGFLLRAGGLVAASFVGSLLSMGFILLLSGKLRNTSLLIVCGIMIGYICSAVTDLVVTFADDTNIVDLHNWSMGSFSGTDWGDVQAMSLTAGAALVLSFFLAKPMDAYRLGEAYARNMGVNIRRFRVELILLSSVLSACVTAFAGPVSFVGVAVPHLVKGLLGTAKPLIVLPACFLGGAAFCLLCDLLARMLFAPVELSISTVTAVFGAPVVIGMMQQRRKHG